MDCTFILGWESGGGVVRAYYDGKGGGELHVHSRMGKWGDCTFLLGWESGGVERAKVKSKKPRKNAQKRKNSKFA